MKKCMSGCGGKMMSNGGAKVAKIKKMAAGGAAGKMIPLYDNNPRVYSGRSLKNGGSASLPVCKGGDVRMLDGSCGKRKFKSGGFKDLSGDGKITKKDILIGRGVIKKTTKKK
jgi:hypothetical protein